MPSDQFSCVRKEKSSMPLCECIRTFFACWRASSMWSMSAILIESVESRGSGTNSGLARACRSNCCSLLLAAAAAPATAGGAATAAAADDPGGRAESQPHRIERDIDGVILQIEDEAARRTAAALAPAHAAVAAAALRAAGLGLGWFRRLHLAAASCPARSRSARTSR